jgi:hypothetical protein
LPRCLFRGRNPETGLHATLYTELFATQERYLTNKNFTKTVRR